MREFKPLRPSPLGGIFARFLLLVVLVACSVSAACSCPTPEAQPQVERIRIFGVVSNRSALESAAGVADFLAASPTTVVQLRTPEQLAALPDDELAALWRAADAVVLLGVFGEDAERIQRVLKDHPLDPKSTVLALSGDPRLLEVNRVDGKDVFAGVSEEERTELTRNLSGSTSAAADRAELAKRFPDQAAWLEASAYRDTRSAKNFAGLLAWVAARHSSNTEVPAPLPAQPIRYLVGGKVYTQGPLPLDAARGTVAIVDYDSGDRVGDRDIHHSLCQALETQQLQCVSVLARWGKASADALASLQDQLGEAELSSLIVLQDFVMGGGAGREAALASLESLDVPVLKAIRMSDRTEAQWHLSHDGVPWDRVHNRVAMPELQGQGQPHVLAVAGQPHDDEQTGLRLVGVEVLTEEVERMAQRAGRWRALQRKAAKDKRVAIVYYNHPPGRHNIGADNLDVPATLLELLSMLEEAGYDVGADRPRELDALMTHLQATGVNLPNDAQALAQQHAKGLVHKGDDYRAWFETLPPRVQRTVELGPLSSLLDQVRVAIEAGEVPLARERVHAVLNDANHVLEGVDHPARERSLRLMQSLEAAYEKALTEPSAASLQPIAELTTALEQLKIEGLSGWGKAPGQVMSYEGDLLIPGVSFGKVFMGPQPPRGWEINEELLHASLSFPPHHQYLAWYHYLREIWGADVVIHVGRHSTAEFLPGKRAGLSKHDFPHLVMADLPNAYIYIVDGVGEGIQAKRRGDAVIIDHLTPALAATPLYDELLTLRQLVESYEAAHEGNNTKVSARAVERIRELIDELELRSELAASMAGELEVRGIGFEEVDDDLLVHEVGHYLTNLQERFMPLGLHVFGAKWGTKQVDTMLESISGDDPAPDGVREALVRSPEAERAALLHALEGRFVKPGKGNDPIRTPEVLPTGRNFHALGGEQIPTRLAWELGVQLARESLKEATSAEDAEAIVLWASDTVRDEGAMIAFALALVGVEPVWNSRGTLKSIRRASGLLPKGGRRDITLVTSGLFRDLYSNHLVWLDRAVLLALEASADEVRRVHPELAGELGAALERLGEHSQGSGGEPLALNQVAAHWVRDTQAALGKGVPAGKAGYESSLRVFGNAPGGYGAGINRLAERSGSWDTRAELSAAWMNRMGHAYGVGVDGYPAHRPFETRLQHTERSFLGRASNLYGLLDNNDAFDYLGGLSLAVEQSRGHPPRSRIISHADPSNPKMSSLEEELLGELRGRELSPAWIAPLMDHDYAGARTMGNEFIENLWGWQVTNPEIVKPWVWDEVERIYIEDGHDLGLDEFLDEGASVHVKINILAVLLVAAQRDYYKPDEATLEKLAKMFADRVVEHGLPGSGHTRPDHPVMEYVAAQLEPELAKAFRARTEKAVVPRAPVPLAPSTISELEVQEPEAQPEPQDDAPLWKNGFVWALLALCSLGAVWGARRSQ